MANVVDFIRRNWTTIVGLTLAVVGVLNPSAVPAVQRFLEVFAAVFLAFGVGSFSARAAVRHEARRLGLLSPRD